jgi:hypothetical protein
MHYYYIIVVPNHIGVGHKHGRTTLATLDLTTRHTYYIQYYIRLTLFGKLLASMRATYYLQYYILLTLLVKLLAFDAPTLAQ